MKKSKFKVKTFVISLAMAVGMSVPLSVQGQRSGTDGFFRGGSGSYENRDEGDVDLSAGITNDSFGAPLGSGLIIMAAAGVGYAIVKSKDKRVKI